MMDLMFFIKTLVLTLLVVMLLQIEVGGKSLETQAMSFMHDSQVTRPLNDVASGAAELVRDLAKKISSGINSNAEKAKPKVEEAKRSTFRWVHEWRSDSSKASESDYEAQ